MSTGSRAPGLVALAGLWGAVDIAYSMYLLASEPAGVLATIVRWIPSGQQAIVVSAILGIVIGFVLFVGAFMTHHGRRAGLLVLLAAIIVYMISGIAYAAWGLVAHEGVDTEIYMANQRYGNEINNRIWAFFVGIGSTSLVVGAPFLWAIRRAWRRFPEGSDTNAGNPPLPSEPATLATLVPASIAGEIERLGALRDRGLLTDGEYQQAKGKLLA
jgi:hypothetical protein